MGDYFRQEPGLLDAADVEHPGLRKLLEKLDNVKPTRSGDPMLLGAWMACCPAHEDRSPSLSVRLWKNGRVSIHCFAECTPDSVLDAAGVSKEAVAPPRRATDEKTIEARYDYVDESGALVYQMCAFSKFCRSFSLNSVASGAGG